MGNTLLEMLLVLLYQYDGDVTLLNIFTKTV